MSDHPDETPQPTTEVLFVATEPDSRYGVRALMEELGFKVHCRDSQIRAFQFLTITDIDLVIVDWQLADSTAASFCGRCRVNKDLQGMPVVVLGEDDETGENCIAALNAGADDFLEHPFVPGVLVARATRLLKKDEGDSSLMTIHVSAGELPGVMQYLETEMKTGTLSVTTDNDTAVIYLREGRLVNAKAGPCTGLEAITEVLAWPSSEVTFADRTLDATDVVFDYELTGTIMNCVVDVDEFREVQTSLPPPEALFKRGQTPLETDCPAGQKAIFEMAVNGYMIDDLLHNEHGSERQATMWLHQLISDGYLDIGDSGPFANYVRGTHDQYRSFQVFERRLDEIVRCLNDVQFPIGELPPALPIAPNDWMTTAPKIVVGGDNPDYILAFIQSLSNIATILFKKRPLVKKGRKNSSITRLFFDEKHILDVQQLPPQLDRRTLASLDDLLQDMVGIVYFSNYHDKENVKENMRWLRVLRQRFKGAYYFVVAQMPNRDGMFEFRLNCDKCGYRLAMDMALAGSVGECPICAAERVIPDALENVSNALQLPSDVPAVMIKPDAEKHCRDLLLFLIDTVLDSANIPLEVDEAAERAEEEVAAQNEQVQSLPVVEDENTATFDSVPTPTVPQPVSAPLPTATDITTEDDVFEPEPENAGDIFDDIFAIDDTRTDLDVDAILGNDEDFDIDDFIRKVNRPN